MAPLDAKPPEFTLPNPVRPAFDTTGHDDHVIVNIGPSHPATHGTVQIIAELDGERVVRTDVHCGYLHRGFEKECESHTWHNLIPYVDRLNYVSALDSSSRPGSTQPSRIARTASSVRFISP